MENKLLEIEELEDSEMLKWRGQGSRFDDDPRMMEDDVFLLFLCFICCVLSLIGLVYGVLS